MQERTGSIGAGFDPALIYPNEVHRYNIFVVLEYRVTFYFIRSAMFGI